MLQVFQPSAFERMVDKVMYDQAAREILGIVAHQDKRGNWEGDDHNCGTDAEIVGQAIEVLKRYFGGGVNETASSEVPV